MYTIYCKGITGKTHKLHIDDPTNDMYDWFTEFHYLDRPDVDLDNYTMTTTIIYSGKND